MVIRGNSIMHGYILRVDVLVLKYIEDFLAIRIAAYVCDECSA